MNTGARKTITSGIGKHLIRKRKIEDGHSTIPKLLCTGCSFTYGEELPDPRTEAYPYQLGKLMNAFVINKGLMGASNDYIFRETVNSAMNHDPGFVVVQWSEINRLELHANATVDIGRYRDYTGVLQTNIRGTGQGVSFIDDYYKHWWNEELALRQYISHVIALQQMLEQRDIDYVMMNAFGTQKVIPKYQIKEYEYVDQSRFLGWPDEGFVEWVYGTEIMPKGHPGPEAHKIVADKLHEYFEG